MRPYATPAIAIVSASVTNGETATAANIDTNPSGNKAKQLSISIYAGTSNNVTNKFQTLKLQESDTTDASNYSDIVGTRGGTDYTVPNANTSAAYFTHFNLDLVGRKRYIRVQVSPRTTQIMSAMAMLEWQSQSPDSAANAGINTVVNV
jgi:hypothetical protein